MQTTLGTSVSDAHKYNGELLAKLYYFALFARFQGTDHHPTAQSAVAQMRDRWYNRLEDAWSPSTSYQVLGLRLSFSMADTK